MLRALSVRGGLLWIDGAAQQLTCLHNLSKRPFASSSVKGSGDGNPGDEQQGSPDGKLKESRREWRQWVEQQLTGLEGSPPATPVPAAPDAPAAPSKPFATVDDLRARFSELGAARGRDAAAGAPARRAPAGASAPPLSPAQRAKPTVVGKPPVEPLPLWDTSVPVLANQQSGYSELGKPPPDSRTPVNPRVEAASPERINPYRLYFPGQSYSPEDLNVYREDSGTAGTVPFRSFLVNRTATDASVQRQLQADGFKNVAFLSGFVTDAGKLVPRRRTRLSHKAHRQLLRSIKTARCMGLMPPTRKLPQFIQANRRSGASRV